MTCMEANRGHKGWIYSQLKPKVGSFQALLNRNDKKHDRSQNLNK